MTHGYKFVTGLLQIYHQWWFTTGYKFATSGHKFLTNILSETSFYYYDKPSGNKLLPHYLEYR